MAKFKNIPNATFDEIFNDTASDSTPQRGDDNMAHCKVCDTYVDWSVDYIGEVIQCPCCNTQLGETYEKYGKVFLFEYL